MSRRDWRSKGYDVYALDIQVGEKLQGLASDKCKTNQLDVTDPGSISKFKSLIGDTPVDVLLNVAGQSQLELWMT